MVEHSSISPNIQVFLFTIPWFVFLWNIAAKHKPSVRCARKIWWYWNEYNTELLNRLLPFRYSLIQVTSLNRKVCCAVSIYVTSCNSLPIRCHVPQTIFLSVISVLPPFPSGSRPQHLSPQPRLLRWSTGDHLELRQESALELDFEMRASMNILHRNSFLQGCRFLAVSAGISFLPSVKYLLYHFLYFRYFYQYCHLRLIVTTCFAHQLVHFVPILNRIYVSSSFTLITT